MISFAYAYFEPVLSFRVHEFTDSAYIEGLVFTGVAIGFAVMALFVSYIVQCISDVTTVTVGLFLAGLSNFLVGPSTLLPNSLILITLGLYLLGFTIALSNVPIISMMIKQAESRFPYEKRKTADL